MNGQSAQRNQFGVSFPRVTDATIAALRAAVKALLAQVRERLTLDSHRVDDVAGMNPYMLRDIGAEAGINSRPAGAVDLQYPRL